MDWEQEQRAPSRDEANRDAHDEWLIGTYEQRYHEWCWQLALDPEDLGSVLAFEEWSVTPEGEE